MTLKLFCPYHCRERAKNLMQQSKLVECVYAYTFMTFETLFKIGTNIQNCTVFSSVRFFIEYTYEFVNFLNLYIFSKTFHAMVPILC